MNAVEVIAEIQALAPEDRARVVEFVHRVEAGEIPETFLQALKEIDAGEAIPIEDAHFDHPPA